jgi:hypothetical protein
MDEPTQPPPPFHNPIREILDSDDSEDVKDRKISWYLFNRGTPEERTKRIRNMLGFDILELIHVGVSREEITREFHSVLDKLEAEDHADCYRKAADKDCSRA